MIDTFAKEYLLNDLRQARQALVDNVVGLSEQDIRRPVTSTGANLLGIIKHVALWEDFYFGFAFARPISTALPDWQDEQAFEQQFWATEDESREEILGRYERACAASDDTIAALEVSADGFVPWWPRPHVKLLNVMVHVFSDTTWHGGQTYTLLDQLQGAPIPYRHAD